MLWAFRARETASATRVMRASPSRAPGVGFALGERATRRSWARASSSSRVRGSATSASSGGDADAPTTHLLTAYELDAAPPLRATPLRLVPSNGAAGAGLGARLWRETRLVREVRAASDDSASASAPRPAAPFETGAELFVPAPRALGDGAVLRVGHPGPATDALERAVSPDAVVGEDDDVAVTPEDDDDAYARVLREALYAHAIAVAADVFEVSRAGARGVVLTSRAGVSLDGGDASAARTFELAIRVPARPLPRSPPSSLPAAPSHLPPRPRVVIRVSHELRDSRTVRELMDDPSARAPPEGARATTLGGPKLDGAISYGNRAGTVGEPRPELGGDSLLEYHRTRYPARVALLERADPAAEAVWLTPLRAGASPMAYPAELLAVIGGSRSRGAPERSMDPAETQRLVTAVRARLGQPFAPVATLSDRMTRLPSPNTASSGPRGALAGAGGLAGGPARPPKSTNEIHRDANATARTPANATARTFTRDAPRVLLMSRGDPEETRARVAAGIAGAHESWGTPTSAAAAIAADVAAADVERIQNLDVPERSIDGIDATSLRASSGAARRFESAFRRAASRGYDVVVVDAGGGWADAAAREAAAAARMPPPRRAGDDWRRVALELGALRGGQAMTFPGFASSGGGAPGVGFGGGVAFVGVGFAGGNARRVVAAVDDDAAILAEAEAFEERETREGDRDESDESDSTLADSSDSTLADSSDSTLDSESDSDADWRADGSALGARAVRFAVDAWTSSGRPAPERVVVHHEGVSPPEFAAAAEATALAMGASRADVVDVSREKSGAGGSGVVTGRALRWDRERGVRAAERGSFWLDGEDAALAVTAGEVEKPNVADAENANANRASGFAPRPLAIRRRRGGEDMYVLAREVVVLAAVGVTGFGGAHALPVTLRGGGRGRGPAVVLL